MVELSQPAEDQLRVVLEERSGLGSDEPLEDLPAITAREIVAAPGDAVWEIFWSSVAAFYVRGDAFASDHDDVRMTLYEPEQPSRFLDFVRATAFTDPDYLGVMAPGQQGRSLPLRHWRLKCNECVIDVATGVQPTVRRLSAMVVDDR
jgi:hypothetical protein